MKSIIKEITVENSERLEKGDYFMPCWWEDIRGGVSIVAGPWKMG